jgi:hypothetical protein
MSHTIRTIRRRALTRIPHLPGSRVLPGEDYATPVQTRIACETPRDRHDYIWVQEKLDGAPRVVAKHNGVIVPLTPDGHHVAASPYIQDDWFARWVGRNHDKFGQMLHEGEWAVGEWLAQAHSTVYHLPHDPFVVFDLLSRHHRALTETVTERCHTHDLPTPRTVYSGPPVPASVIDYYLEPGGHGNQDPVEGAVWRIERHHPRQQPRVDFLVQWVRPDKPDRHYLPHHVPGGRSYATWNWIPA